MADYIERDAAIKRFNFAVLDCLGMEPTIRAGDIIKALESIPAADVVPMDFHERCLQIEIQKRMALERKRGKWRLLTDEEMIAKDEFGYLWAKTCWMNYECTSCGELVHNELKGRGDARTNFCPNCGADMREEQDGR